MLSIIQCCSMADRTVSETHWEISLYIICMDSSEVMCFFHLMAQCFACASIWVLYDWIRFYFNISWLFTLCAYWHALHIASLSLSTFYRFSFQVCAFCSIFFRFILFYPFVFISFLLQFIFQRSGSACMYVLLFCFSLFLPHEMACMQNIFMVYLPDCDFFSFHNWRCDETCHVTFFSPKFALMLATISLSLSLTHSRPTVIHPTTTPPMYEFDPFALFFWHIYFYSILYGYTCFMW